jgi:putative addiction module killer protein
MIRVEQFTTPGGRDVFQEWLDGVGDTSARAAILRRIYRLQCGLLGDWRPCRDGVIELRVDVGPGYRVYCARVSPDHMVLITGGTKRRQAADIDRAVRLWQRHQRSH